MSAANVAGSAHLKMSFCIAGNKKNSETVVMLDTQITQQPSLLPSTSGNRDSDVFNGGATIVPLDNQLSVAPGQVLEKKLTAIHSVHAKLDEMNGRLKVVEDTVAQLKQGQFLDMDANQQWKAQVANEVAKISQQQDIGENL